MGLTDKCHLYGAVHEEGLNRVVRHAMRQRPSLFNYATAGVADDLSLLCVPIDADPEVTKRGNPLLTIVPPLPVIGAAPAVLMNISAQLTRLQIDFHPGGAVPLPPELNPPLAKQTLAFRGTAVIGLGCPGKRAIDGLPPPSSKPREEGPPTVVPTQKLLCCEFSLVGIGGVCTDLSTGSPRLVATVDKLEIVDIAPDELESMLECYAYAVAQLVLLPKLAVALPKVVLEGLGLTVSFAPTPTSPALPYNPAIEDDQLKVFINMEVSP